MSPIHTSAALSSSFQLLINNALEAYKQRTKKNLLTHPLAERLQACDSPSAILLVLRQQVQEINQYDRLTKWLDPTVNVLYALSAKLGEGIGLVGFDICLRLPETHVYLFGRLSRLQK